jgi:hypothetical protein
VPSPLANIFREAAELNIGDGRREGNVVELPAGREVIATGDLHGHRENLAKIASFADLPNRKDRLLILQEIIHGPADARTGHDRSVDVLLRAARLKIAYPEQVVFLLGNHDVAQVTGNEITKAGRGVCEAFVRGVEYACGADGAPEVLDAVAAFLLSAPIAVRCPGGVMLTHTLPTPQRMDLAGWDLPAGPYRPEDLRRGGPVYEWTWGRKHTPEQIERLAERLGASFFILAHKGIAAGYKFVSPRAVIITAEHERGCILPFASDAPLTEETARQRLRPIAGLAKARR